MESLLGKQSEMAKRKELLKEDICLKEVTSPLGSIELKAGTPR